LSKAIEQKNHELMQNLYARIPDPVNINVDQRLQNILLYLLKPDLDESPTLATNLVMRRLCTIRHFVAAAFWREHMNSRFLPSLRINKSYEKEIKTEAELWSKILDMLTMMGQTGYLSHNPNVALLGLIKEQKLALFDYAPSEEIGATAFLARIANENKQLEDYTNFANPFDPQTSKLTHEIVDIALQMGSEYDNFARRYYMPIIRVRMAKVADLRINKAKAYNENLIAVRSGRRKEVTKKIISELPS
jgi:hypothetical protein